MKGHTVLSVVEWVREVKGDPTISLASLQRVSGDDLTVLLEAMWKAPSYYNNLFNNQKEAAE